MKVSLKPLFVEIPGTPVPKPRMTQRDKFMPSLGARRYFSWAKHARLCGAQALMEQYGSRGHFAGPVAIRAIFYLPIPRSVSKAEREARRLEGHVQKPDLKNLVAGLEDALNKVLWGDDAQIDTYREARKLWTDERQGLTQLTVYVEKVTD